jgi:hypothetical protein
VKAEMSSERMLNPPPMITLTPEYGVEVHRFVSFSTERQPTHRIPAILRRAVTSVLARIAGLVFTPAQPGPDRRRAAPDGCDRLPGMEAWIPPRHGGMEAGHR